MIHLSFVIDCIVLLEQTSHWLGDVIHKLPETTAANVNVHEVVNMMQQ